MYSTTNVSNNGEFSLNVGHHSVVQKGDVGQSYIYALQLRNNQHSTFVLRRNKFGTAFNTVLELDDSAAGHTQTWSYAEPNNWFIGTKSNSDGWDTQIARVNLKNGIYHNSNYDFPRLAYLDRAGNVDYVGSMERSEASVSPDHTKFLLVTVNDAGTGYFTIYNLAAINNALDSVQYQDGADRYYDIGMIPDSDIVDQFTIDRLYKGIVNHTADKTYLVNSLQGFDIDNNADVFISSQPAPGIVESTGRFPYTYHKEILVIPANARYDQSQWTNVNLSGSGVIDKPGTGLHTEVEGIQAIDANNAYLTVAYHVKKRIKNSKYYESYTDYSTIYQLSWY